MKFAYLMHMDVCLEFRADFICQRAVVLLLVACSPLLLELPCMMQYVYKENYVYICKHILGCKVMFFLACT